MLQCGYPELLRVRKLHRRLALCPVGGHGVQLSASQSHVPGTACSNHTGFSVFLYFSIYSLLFSFVSVSLCLSLMWFQAINKGPSRLPGSTVDIRIPNRLAGSGADMFHIIETQVDANSSQSTLFIQPRPLFISLLTCRQPHFELIHPTYTSPPCFSSSEDTFVYRQLLIRRLFVMAWAICLVWGTSGPVKIEAKVLMLLLKLTSHFVSQHFAFR